MALQGPFGTAEGRETMTTTPETSLKVNTDPHRAHTACAKPSFYSLAPNAASVRSNQGKTLAILQGPFGTAEGRETMTTTPETSLEANADQLQACNA